MSEERGGIDWSQVTIQPATDGSCIIEGGGVSPTAIMSDGNGGYESHGLASGQGTGHSAGGAPEG